MSDRTGSWYGYRDAAELAAELGLAGEELARARDITDAHVRAWHLSQVRRDQDRTQGEVAQAMGIAQPRVSEIEHGEFDRVTVSALHAYVRALGGSVRIVADFGDRRYHLS